MRRAVAVIAIVAVAPMPLGPMWPEIPYAFAMIGVDTAALLAITWNPAGKWQSIVGGSYLIQIGIHIGRIFSAEKADINSYWWGLSIVAILQLLLIGGWWLNERVTRHRFRGVADPAPAHSRAKGVAE